MWHPISIRQDQSQFYHGNTIHCLVQKPTRRTIFFQGSQLFLPFPYVVFIRTISTLYVSFAVQNPLEHLNVEYFMPPMGNIFHNGEVCLGQYKIGQSIPDDYDESVNRFWRSKFAKRTREYLGIKIFFETFGSYEKWSEIPLQDILQPAHWSKKHHDDRVFRLIENIHST